VNIIDQYPRERKDLPPEYIKIYTDHYKKNRDGATLGSFFSQMLEKWMHLRVVEDLRERNLEEIATLEIGAGTLNHLNFEGNSKYDVIEPFTELFADSKNKRKIRNFYKDIKEVNNEQYDRIISIATFEHIENLPEVVAKTTLLLKENGVLRVGIPNEGTILWKLAYSISTGIDFYIRYGLKYSILMNYEHVNTAADIDAVLRYFYRSVKYKVFGINKNLGLYRFYECKFPNTKISNMYLREV